MPELPDVEVFRKFIHSRAINRRIQSVEARDARMIKGMAAKTLAGRLQGKTLKTTARHGKELGIGLDNGNWLILHFGMTGGIDEFKNEEQEPKYTRLRLDFKNGHHLAYTSRRRLGRIRLVDDFEEYVESNDLGPDALDVDLKQLRELLSQHRGGIKSFLMNQEHISGLGNVYVDEILFRAKIHPETSLDDLDDKQRKALARAMSKVLRMAIKRGADADKFPRTWLLSHRGKNEKCPRCHGRLKQTDISGRTTYFCPKCQKKS